MIIAISGHADAGKDTVGRIIQYLVTEKSNAYTGLEMISTIQEYVAADNPYYSEVFKIKKFADPLRKVAAVLLGMELSFLYTAEFKKMVLPEDWWYYTDGCSTQPFLTGDLDKLDGYGAKLIKTTGRIFLQRLGTNAVREVLHDNAWVNALFAEYQGTFRGGGLSLDDLTQDYPNWIITDTRFPNELAAVKDRKGIAVRINREFYELDKFRHVWYDKQNKTGWATSHNANYYSKEEALKYFRQEKTKDLHISETALDNAEFDWWINNDDTIEVLIERVREMLNQFGII